MQIIKDFIAVDLALYYKKHLIVSDVHIGIERQLTKQGMLVPTNHFTQLMQRLESIFEKCQEQKLEIDTVVINGDLKDSFDSISDHEWRHTLKFLDLIARNCNKIVLVKGNHDTITEIIAKKRNLSVVDSYAFQNVLCIHGHQEPTSDQLKQTKTIIIGHEHPALVVEDGIRKETYKCFLAGKYNKKQLIVLPSFNPLSDGTSIFKSKHLSPLLSSSLDRFNVFSVEDQVYDFGSVKEIKTRLG